MGKIKGWTKKRNNEIAETWVLTNDSDSFVDLVKGNKNRPYYVFTDGSIMQKRGFTTYKQALDFAIAYMKSNPRG